MQLIKKYLRARKRKKAIKLMQSGIRAIQRLEIAMFLLGWTRHRRKQFRRDFIKTDGDEKKLVELMKAVKRDL